MKIHLLTTELSHRAQCFSSGTLSPIDDSKFLTARILTIFRPSFFKTLVDHEVTVELKNDISIKGILKSVDQFLNIKLDDIQVVEELKYPHLVSPASYSSHLQTIPRIPDGADGRAER